MLRSFLLFSAMLAFALTSPAAKKDIYLFAWCGDSDRKGPDFLAVLDADPDSATYGKVLHTIATGTNGSMPHHTEIEMPRSGFLMANGFEASRTWIFDLRKPLQPRIVASFDSFDGYLHPHTFFRLPNGNVLATFQYRGRHDPKAPGGGLVEITDRGKLVRSGSAVDPKDSVAKAELIRPYSIELLPSVDRIVSTNTSMHQSDGPSRTLQVWQASSLKVLRTIVLPPGPRGDEHQYPGEPRLLEDGKTVMIHTFSCGLYTMRDVAAEQPAVQFVYAFPGTGCGVPLRVGHFWIATVPDTHSLTVLDISDPAHPREVSRVDLGAGQKPHWVSIDSSGTRIVLNSDEKVPDRRLFIINFDPKTGAVKLDERFRDVASDRPGVAVTGKTWPQGFSGNTYAHGTVFSR